MYASDVKHSDPTLEEKLHKLYTLSGKKNLALDLFREPYIQLLAAYGNPHKKLPPIIHVAGTNGKGSTIAFMRTIYESAGYKVHAYTSPHLIRFNERIVLAGKQIDDQTLETMIDEVLELNGDNDATFFEATTAMAFAAFSRIPADICLLEVGLGGRLDCTNIIESPALTVITDIGMDHMDYLGDTIEKIAAEKGGIIKQNCPCILAQQSEKKVAPSIEKITHEKNAELTKVKPIDNFDYDLALPGPHQIKNATTAITAINALQNQFPVTEDHIREGLKTAKWPARFQELNNEKLDMPDHFKIWLDGGHNEQAAHALASHLKTLDAPIHLILGMLKHKDPCGFLKPILPHIQSITLTQIPDEPHSLNNNELEKILSTLNIKIPFTTTSNYQDALNQLKSKINFPAHILIGGSLYLAGTILKDLESQKSSS